MLKRRKVESKRHYNRRLRKKHAAALAKITIADDLERQQRHTSPDRKRTEPKLNHRFTDRITGYKNGTKTDNESLVDEALEIYDGHISPARRKSVHRRLRSQVQGMSPTSSSFNSLRYPGSGSFSESATFSNYSFDSYNNEWTTRIVGTVTNTAQKPLPTTSQMEDAKNAEQAQRNFICCDFPTVLASQWVLQRPRRQIPGMTIGEETKLWKEALAIANASGSRRSSLIDVEGEREIDQIEVIAVEKGFQTKDSFNYAESKEDGLGMVFAPPGGRRRQRVPEPWWKKESWTDSSFIVGGTDGESRETFYSTDLRHAKGKSGKMVEYSSASRTSLEMKVCDGGSSDLDESLDERIARKNRSKFPRRDQSQGREQKCPSESATYERRVEAPSRDINQKMKGRSHDPNGNYKKSSVEAIDAVEVTVGQSASNITDATDLSELVRRSDRNFTNHQGGKASKSCSPCTIDLKTTNDTSRSKSPKSLKVRNEGISKDRACRSMSPIQFRGRPPYFPAKNEKISYNVDKSPSGSPRNASVICATSRQNKFHSSHRGAPDSPISLYDTSPYFQEIDPVVEKKTDSESKTMKKLLTDNSMIGCAKICPSTSTRANKSNSNNNIPEEKQLGPSDEFDKLKSSKPVEEPTLSQSFLPPDECYNLKLPLHVEEKGWSESYHPKVKDHEGSPVASPTRSVPKSPMRVFGDPPILVGGDENGPLSCPRLLGTGFVPFLQQSASKEDKGDPSQSRDIGATSPKHTHTPESNETSKSLNELKKLVTALSPVKEVAHDGAGVLLFRPTINIYNGTQINQEQNAQDVLTSTCKISDGKPTISKEKNEEHFDLQKRDDTMKSSCFSREHPEIAIPLSNSGNSIDDELRQLAASEMLLRKELEEIQHRSAERRWQVKFSEPFTSIQKEFSVKAAPGKSPSESNHQPRFDCINDPFCEPQTPTNRKQIKDALSFPNNRQPKSPMRIYGDPPFFVDGPIPSPKGTGLRGLSMGGVQTEYFHPRINEDNDAFQQDKNFLSYGRPGKKLSGPDHIIDLSTKNSIRTSPSSIIDLSHIDGNDSPHFINQGFPKERGVFTGFNQPTANKQCQALSKNIPQNQPDQSDSCLFQNCIKASEAQGNIDRNFTDLHLMNHHTIEHPLHRSKGWTEKFPNTRNEDILVPSLSNIERQSLATKIGESEEIQVEREISWKSIQQLYNLNTPEHIEKKGGTSELGTDGHACGTKKNNSTFFRDGLDRFSSSDSFDRSEVCSTIYSGKSITFLKPAEGFPNIFFNQGANQNEAKCPSHKHITALDGEDSGPEKNARKNGKYTSIKKSFIDSTQALQTEKSGDCSDSVSSTSIFGGIDVDPDDQSLFYALLRDDEFQSVTKSGVQQRQRIPRDAKTSELLNKILSRHGCLRTQMEAGVHSMASLQKGSHGNSDTNEKCRQTAQDVKNSVPVSPSPAQPCGEDPDEFLQSRIQRLRKLQNKLPSSMTERIRSTSTPKAERPSLFSMKLTNARQRASKSLKQIRKNTNGDGIIEVLVQMDAPELSTRKKELPWNRERTGRELTLNVKGNSCKSKDLVQSLPLSARSRSVTSAKPGSLLWQAMAGRDK